MPLCCGLTRPNLSGCSLTLGQTRALSKLSWCRSWESPLNPSPSPWTSERWMGALLAESPAIRFLSTYEYQEITVSVHRFSPCTRGFGVFMAPEHDPLVDWATVYILVILWVVACSALRSVLSRHSLPGKSSCRLGRSLLSLCHFHRIPGPPEGLQQDLCYVSPSASTRRLTPLTIKMALEEWRHWLEGMEHPLLVWTDHKILEYLRTAKRLNSRQARWALLFTRFNHSLFLTAPGPICP